MRFYYELTKNIKCFKSFRGKWLVLRINAKHMFARWLLENKLLVEIKSIQAYWKLHEAGFRIGHFNPQPSDEYERFRFFWKNKMIRDVADINRYQSHWSTTLNGHVEDLNK